MPHVNVNIPVTFIKEDNRVIAYTPVLDISTTGKNQAEAQERFGEIVSIFLTDLIENNTVDIVLAELGWQKDECEPSVPHGKFI